MKSCLDEIDQHNQCKQYQLQAHEVERHNEETLHYLRALYAKSQRGEDVWDELSDHRKSFKSGVTGPLIKNAFRRFVGTLQGNRCCYCRRWLLNIAHAKPIEHILPRNSYPQFSLQFWNLAVACFDCNQLKERAPWGGFPPGLSQYPCASTFTEFFHPRFHAYAEHVSFDRRETNHISHVTYTGHTPQGKHLCGELLYIIAARENLYRNNPSLAEAVATLQDFQEQHPAGDLSAVVAFRSSLNDSLQRQLDDSGVDEWPLHGPVSSTTGAKDQSR